MAIKWVRESEVAQLLQLHPGTLRLWRWRANKTGHDPSGLVWRRFGRAVRYAIGPNGPLTEAENAQEARDGERG